MADLGVALAAALNADEAVTDITETFVPSYAPQRQTYPQIIYEIADAEPDQTLGGVSGLVQSTLKIRCVDKTYAGAAALGAAVKACLVDESGTFGGVVVQGFFLKEVTDDEYTSPLNENMTLYEKAVTLDVFYNDF
jgi:hypothetical protein